MSLPILTGKQVRSGEEYTFQMRGQHLAVLEALELFPGTTDSELTFLLEQHMIAARRCELRDAGLVTQAGTKAGSKTWRTTEYGSTVLRENRREETHA